MYSVFQTVNYFKAGKAHSTFRCAPSHSRGHSSFRTRCFAEPAKHELTQNQIQTQPSAALTKDSDINVSGISGLVLRSSDEMFPAALLLRKRSSEAPCRRSRLRSLKAGSEVVLPFACPLQWTLIRQPDFRECSSIPSGSSTVSDIHSLRKKRTLTL